MPLGVYIQLYSVGSDVGPTADFYSDVDGYDTPFETGVDVSTLSASTYFDTIPDGTTIIKIQSLGECTNSIYIPIDNLPCDCDNVCCNFQLTNNSGVQRNWSYWDCNGDFQLGVYEHTEVIRFCANKTFGTILVDSGCTLTEIGCCVECKCYGVFNYTNSFKIKYRNCEGDLVEEESISDDIDYHYIIYCGGYPTIIEGWADEIILASNDDCNYVDGQYECPILE